MLVRAHPSGLIAEKVAMTAALARWQLRSRSERVEKRAARWSNLHLHMHNSVCEDPRRPTGRARTTVARGSDGEYGIGGCTGYRVHMSVMGMRGVMGYICICIEGAVRA